MAIDSYMVFQLYGDQYMTAESQVDFSQNTQDNLMKLKPAIPTSATAGSYPNAGPAVFEIQDFNFDIEQTLNIGSQSSGAGAGKVTFNPFTINRKIDKSSPKLFEMACSGTAFKQVTLVLRKSSGAGQAGAANTSGVVFLRFDFKLVAVKSISWSNDDESPKEEVKFEYGGLIINYCQQAANGSMLPAVPGGWNRVRNVQDADTATVIQQV